MNYTDPREALNGARSYGPGAANGAGRPRPEPEPEGEPSGGAFDAFDAADLANEPVPERRWHVRDMIPAGNVVLLGGAGGVGKSALAMQLAFCTALNLSWLGQETASGPAVFLTAEDDRGELHRRLSDMCGALGRSIKDMPTGRLILWPRAGTDAALAVPHPETVLAPTALFRELEARTARARASLVVLDTLADLFGGDENRRAEARAFVAILRGLAMRTGAAVVLLAHPSLAGLASGSGLSGSTAWDASVRARLFFERVTSDGIEPDPDARRLRLVKSNYSRAGAEIALRLNGGAFVAEAGASRLDRMAATAKAERVFLKLLRQFTEEGRNVNHAGGANYAPRLFGEHPGAEGVTKRAFGTAMNALLAEGRIRIEEHGPPSKRRARLVEASGDA